MSNVIYILIINFALLHSKGILSQMNKSIEELLREWTEAKAATEKAYNDLKDAAIAAYEIKVGDTVRIGKKVGVVTRLRFSTIWRANEGLQVDITPIAHPLKKDGTVSKVGEIHSWFGDKVEVIQKAGSSQVLL
jgi:hypothetical protein